MPKKRSHIIDVHPKQSWRCTAASSAELLSRSTTCKSALSPPTTRAAHAASRTSLEPSGSRGVRARQAACCASRQCDCVKLFLCVCSHVTRHTSQVTHHKSHITRHTSRVTQRHNAATGGFGVCDAGTDQQHDAFRNNKREEYFIRRIMLVSERRVEYCLTNRCVNLVLEII